MTTVDIPNWRARPYQRPAYQYLRAGGTRLVMVCHRRWGKDDLALNWTCEAMHRRPATYWHMLPQAEQARKAIWEAVDPHTGVRRIDQAFPRELRASTNESEMRITFANGGVWRVIGSDNYNALVGSPPAGVVFSEWPLADPQAFGYLSPILAENGGWAIFIYTPRGKNHGWSLYTGRRDDPNWHVELQTVKDTGIISQQALDDDLADKIAVFGEEQGRALWDQEWMCSFEAAVQGAYYGREMRVASEESRITGVPLDRDPLVFTGWDIGIDDATAIWLAQVVGREVHLVDYYEASGQDAKHYADHLRELSERRRFKFDTHFLPHDAGYLEKGTGRSYQSHLYDAKLPGQITVLPRSSNLIADINATRGLIAKCWFDETRCERGVEALRQYRREWDPKLKTYRQRPFHDWTSHGADAFRYLGLGLIPSLGHTAQRRERKQRSAWAA